MGRLLVYASIAYVWLVTGDDPDEHEDWLLSDREAATMAHPLARLFSASQLNKRWGRKLIDSNDVVAAVVVAGLYARRTREMWKVRPQRARERARKNVTEEAHGDFPADQFLAS